MAPSMTHDVPLCLTGGFGSGSPRFTGLSSSQGGMGLDFGPTNHTLILIGLRADRDADSQRRDTRQSSPCSAGRFDIRWQRER